LSHEGVVIVSGCDFGCGSRESDIVSSDCCGFLREIRSSFRGGAWNLFAVRVVDVGSTFAPSMFQAWMDRTWSIIGNTISRVVGGGGDSTIVGFGFLLGRRSRVVVRTELIIIVACVFAVTVAVLGTGRLTVFMIVIELLCFAVKFSMSRSLAKETKDG
jgi:hypothetical protein